MFFPKTDYSPLGKLRLSQKEFVKEEFGSAMLSVYPHPSELTQSLHYQNVKTFTDLKPKKTVSVKKSGLLFWCFPQSTEILRQISEGKPQSNTSEIPQSLANSLVKFIKKLRIYIYAFVKVFS